MPHDRHTCAAVHRRSGCFQSMSLQTSCLSVHVPHVCKEVDLGVCRKPPQSKHLRDSCALSRRGTLYIEAHWKHSRDRAHKPNLAS